MTPQPTGTVSRRTQDYSKIFCKRPQITLLVTTSLEFLALLSTHKFLTKASCTIMQVSHHNLLCYNVIMHS